MTLPNILHFEFSLNFTGCLCNVYPCLYVFVPLCECSCICGGQRTTWVLYLRKIIHLLWDRASQWPRVCQFRLDQRASESQGSFLAPPPQFCDYRSMNYCGDQENSSGKVRHSVLSIIYLKTCCILSLHPSSVVFQGPWNPCSRLMND